jgi:hypothetical protein
MLVKHVQAPLDVTVGLERSYTRAEIEVQHTDLFSSGGHLKPDPFSRAASILKTHGREVAEHVASFEARQVKEVKEFVKREGIDCDFEETEVMDVCFYEAGRDKFKSDLASLAEAGISTVRDIGYHSDTNAEEVCIRFLMLEDMIWQQLTHIAGRGRERSESLSYIRRGTSMALQARNSHAGASSCSWCEPTDQYAGHQHHSRARVPGHPDLDGQQHTRLDQMQHRHTRHERIRLQSCPRATRQNCASERHGCTTRTNNRQTSIGGKLHDALLRLRVRLPNSSSRRQYCRRWSEARLLQRPRLVVQCI